MKITKKNKLSLIIFILIALAIVFDFFSYTGYYISENSYDFDDLPDSFELELGKEFRLDIDIEGQDYKFSDDTELFDIDKESGLISFVPNESGEFEVVIIALKGVDDLHFKLINFKVVE